MIEYVEVIGCYNGHLTQIYADGWERSYEKIKGHTLEDLAKNFLVDSFKTGKQVVNLALGT